MLLRSRSINFGARRFASTYTDAHRQVIAGLQGRSLLRIDDYNADELKAVIELSKHIKFLCKTDSLPRPLVGKTVATIFQKRSTRTRVSTETGMNLLGGHALFLSGEDIQLGVNETIRDSASVLSRYNSLLLARVFGHSVVEELAQFSSVPVINALSSMHHPLQTLADYMTMDERYGSDNVSGKTLCWIGDGNNVLHDLMLAAPMMGVNLKICTPKSHEPSPRIVDDAKKLASKFGTSIWLGDSPLDAISNSNIIVTDTWVSMGQEDEAKKRRKIFAGYQITSEMLKAGGASDDWIFMHCLPRHAEEVTDDVFYSDQSVVFDEAENRMYTVMAVMSSMLGHKF